MHDLLLAFALLVGLQDFPPAPSVEQVADSTAYCLTDGKTLHRPECPLRHPKAVPYVVVDALCGKHLCPRCFRDVVPGLPLSRLESRIYSLDGARLRAQERKAAEAEAATVQPFDSTYSSSSTRSSAAPTYSSRCGARTKKGGSCMNRVSGGGYCHLHR